MIRLRLFAAAVPLLLPQVSAGQTAAPQNIAKACPAAPAQIAFAPPTGVPMLLVVKTERPASSGDIFRFSLTYRLRFDAQPRGFLLTATLLNIDAPAGGTAGGAMLAILAPMVDQPVAYHVGMEGDSLLLKDGEALWRAVTDRLSAKARATPVSEGRQVGAMLISLPVEQREALLTADIRQMMRFAGQPWTHDFSSPPDFDPTNCGEIGLTEREGDGQTAAGFVTERRWRVDVRTGLVRIQDDSKWLRQAEGTAPQLASRTTRSLTPE